MARHGCLIFFYLFSWFVLCRSERHECDRLCDGDKPPKKCFYSFVVGISRREDDGLNEPFLSINGKRPGPLISVCENDTVIVDVKNQLPAGMETTLHWHGLVEGNSPFMDGVPMISQCPILPHTSFRYQIKASKSGTYFYHSHSVAQQLDGIYGPFIIHNEKDKIHPEKTVVISPQMKNLQVMESNFEADLNVTGLLVTVFSDSYTKNKENSLQRLRIINAAALDCPLTLFTHTVPLRIVAVDGNDVKPCAVNEVVIHPGERIDLLVKPEVMKVTHIVGHNLCKGHAKYGFRSGISDKTHLIENNKILNLTEMLHKLQPKEAINLTRSDLNVYLPFDASIYEDYKGAVDFRYKLGAITPYVPSILGKDSVSLLQIYNKSFLYPPSPLLSQPDDLPQDILCHLDEDSDRCIANDNGFCECLHNVNLPHNIHLDLVLINEGKHTNSSPTVYIHGYSFYVLAMESFNKPISIVEFRDKEDFRQIKRNLVDPVRKDTIVVPNKGFVILRMLTNKPGKWLMESRTSKARTGFGLEMILNVKNPLGKEQSPEGFPVCGTMKEPDLVFSVD